MVDFPHQVDFAGATAARAQIAQVIVRLNVLKKRCPHVEENMKHLAGMP